MVHKGSKKHILDLIDREDFIYSLNTILIPYEASVTNRELVQPKGIKDASEYAIQSFINMHKLAERFPSLKSENSNLNKWWNPSGGKAPTWDMILVCHLNGKDALLLVEAKAHINEFNKDGKFLKNNPSKGTQNNHQNINERILEACKHLKNSNSKFNISMESHYQLSNRVAFAWKLSQLKVPVILLYLGFIGDYYFKDFFINRDNWKDEFFKYINGVVPKEFINSNDSDFLFIESSLPINN